MFSEIKTPTNNKLVAIILFSFLATFLLSRITVYAILARYIPDLFLVIRGVHVHHFTYGVFILALAGWYLILKRPSVTANSFILLTVCYGIGLGLTFDEFGMWIRLQDDYWVRQSYDAIIIISLLLLNGIYLRWVVFGVKEVYYIVKAILLLPVKVLVKIYRKIIK